LTEALKKQKVPLKIIRIILDKFEKSWNIVKKSDNKFKVLKGSNQGDPLSSQLFLIYINDINEIEHEGVDNNFNIIDFILKLFADDLVLLANDRKEAQKAINRIVEYSNEKKLKINIKKTMWMEITEKKNKNENNAKTTENLYIGENQIIMTNEFKYLGL